jgi:hypothetical protein
MTARSPPLGGKGLRPTPEIVAIATNIPNSIAPESPMKILAGWKFHGRKPTQMPAVMHDKRAAAEAVPKRLSDDTMYTKKVPEAIATMPAASPSSPSTRFTAFTITTTQSTVNGTARSAPSVTMLYGPPPLPGITKYCSWTPASTRMPAQKICPVSLVRALIPRRSSTIPSARIAEHASRAPRGSALPWFMASKNGSSRETPRPTRSPR